MKNNKAKTIYDKVQTAMEREAPLDEIHLLIESLAEIGDIGTRGTSYMHPVK